MDTLLQITLYAVFGILLLALCLTFFRLIKGPVTSDRIVAMDLIASITTGLILVYAVLIDNALYFDIAIIISLISFIGTIGISIYIKQKK